MVGWIESDLIRLGLALFGSAIISILAYYVKALSISGAVSAFFMGGSFVFFGEPIWFILLITFFLSSTFWSKYKKYTKAKQVAEAQYEKTGSRDSMQVFANGGLAMLLCIVSYFVEASWLLPLFIMIMAIVNADTWATEIGSLSRSQPRHIITGQVVEAGTSGAISWLGTFAACAGAALIGCIAAIYTGQWIYLVLATAAGLFGCMLDSLLGATIQRMFRCSVCNKATERVIHCEVTTKHEKGYMWINNDVVNIASSLLGSTVIWMIYTLFK